MTYREKMNNTPDFLYHYTSIDGLAHILSSKKIRFSRLDALDDINEGQSEDGLDWRKYFFISCWTSDHEESIPLWHMYTPNMKGVRIKLPKNMFKENLIPLSDFPSFINIADTSSLPAGADIKVKCKMPYEDLHGEDYFVMPTSFNSDVWPLKVIYTDDLKLLRQQILIRDRKNDQTILNMAEVARYKSKAWEFQKEWRFKIHCHNAAPRSLKNKVSEDTYYSLMLKELSSINKGVSQQHLFMNLSDEALEEIEITLGPKVDEAQRIIIKSLIACFCPKASFKDSALTGTIR